MANLMVVYGSLYGSEVLADPDQVIYTNRWVVKFVQPMTSEDVNTLAAQHGFHVIGKVRKYLS